MESLRLGNNYFGKRNELDKDKLLEMLRKMYRIRFFEEKGENLYKSGLITGDFHQYIGEEAVAVGACAVLRDDDYIVSTHRGHGHCIAKGGDIKKMMAELLGRKTGYCGGRAGDMHMLSMDIGLLASVGTVGGGISTAVGAAFSSRYRGSEQVALAFFGDGATNTGAFHESLNLASVWKLPVVFVCENNLYGVSLRVSESSGVEDIADRATSYGIPGEIVDGMDVLAVCGTVAEAVSKAREGGGPSLIECKTYRFGPHWVGDPDPSIYRSDEEVQKWKEKDPILVFRSKLLEDRIFKERKLDAVKELVEEEIEEAIEFAKNSPFPDPDTVENYVYHSEREISR